MMRALWTSASGMVAQQMHMDTLSNDLANVNTAGFKKSRVDFNDLIYAAMRSGNRQTANGPVPTLVEVGHGVSAVATKKMFTEGSLQETGNPTDFALTGEGFFQVEMPDGSLAYTRDGTFTVNPEDTTTLYTNNGYKVADCTWDNDTKTGTFVLADFVNPQGLESIGKNLYKQTTASGDPVTGDPDSEGFGGVEQNFTEMSNVQVVEEMVNMIVAQRAYESNTKTIQASDEMLAMANGLKR